MFEFKIPKIITVCNYGYTDYTLNLYESMKKCNDNQILDNFICVCFDEKSSQKMTSHNINNILWKNDNVSEETKKYGKDGWIDMMIAKMNAIHYFLKKNEDIILTDGDIVWFKNPIPYIKSALEFHHKNKSHPEMLFQVDSKYDQNSICLCGGFYYCKSTENTIELFNTKNLDKNVYQKEQPYLNDFIFKNKIPINILDRNLFPNGSYWYEYNNKIKNDCFIVHFNWTKEDKKDVMKRYNLYYI